MHKDDRASAEFEGAAHDLAGIDRGVINRADALYLVGDQMIFLVENVPAIWNRAAPAGKVQWDSRLSRD
jgi:hypothetical protein